jgi:hypothetical protein
MARPPAKRINARLAHFEKLAKRLQAIVGMPSGGGRLMAALAIATLRRRDIQDERWEALERLLCELFDDEVTRDRLGPDVKRVLRRPSSWSAAGVLFAGPVDADDHGDFLSAADDLLRALGLRRNPRHGAGSLEILSHVMVECGLATQPPSPESVARRIRSVRERRASGDVGGGKPLRRAGCTQEVIDANAGVLALRMEIAALDRRPVDVARERIAVLIRLRDDSPTRDAEIVTAQIERWQRDPAAMAAEQRMALEQTLSELEEHLREGVMANPSSPTVAPLRGEALVIWCETVARKLEHAARDRPRP